MQSPAQLMSCTVFPSRTSLHGIADDGDVLMGTGGRNGSVASQGLNTNGDASAVGEGVARNLQVAAAACLQPPVFRRDQNAGHPATFDMVAADFAVACLDQEAPTGPLMFQGNHGGVAYRNIKIQVPAE